MIEFERQETTQNFHGEIPWKTQFGRWENIRLNLRKMCFGSIGGTELDSNIEEFVFAVLNLRRTNSYK
jgi:hypothetical protein